MKVRLDYDIDWRISVEPETEMEKCALEYLANRPKEQVKVLITRLGLFSREDE